VGGSNGGILQLLFNQVGLTEQVDMGHFNRFEQVNFLQFSRRNVFGFEQVQGKLIHFGIWMIFAKGFVQAFQSRGGSVTQDRFNILQIHMVPACQVAPETENAP
jgi:hypothetical protein